jgi:hypothetical protein
MTVMENLQMGAIVSDDANFAPISNASSPCSRASSSGCISAAARCPAASSRCSRSPAP